MLDLTKLIANFYTSSDPDSALNLIFSYLVDHRDAIPFEHVVANLYRLYTWDQWEPAQMYLYILTGTMCEYNDDDEEGEAIFFSPTTMKELAFSTSTILERCSFYNGPLLGLHYDEDYDREDEDDSETTDYDDSSRGGHSAEDSESETESKSKKPPKKKMKGPT
jgi:hypothetical protein